MARCFHASLGRSRSRRHCGAARRLGHSDDSKQRQKRFRAGVPRALRRAGGRAGHHRIAVADAPGGRIGASAVQQPTRGRSGLFSPDQNPADHARAGIAKGSCRALPGATGKTVSPLQRCQALGAALAARDSEPGRGVAEPIPRRGAKDLRRRSVGVRSGSKPAHAGNFFKLLPRSGCHRAKARGGGYFSSEHGEAHRIAIIEENTMATATAIRPTVNDSCDLRDWLKEVKRLEQLEQISGADWNLEIGALTEIILERIATPPAVLFDQVPGFDPNRRVLANMLETLERTALTLNLPLELKTIPLIDALRARLRTMQPIKANVVSSGRSEEH